MQQAHDPLRRNADPVRPVLPSCTHCGEDMWLDLGQATTALALRDREDSHARVRASLGAQLLVGLGAGALYGWLCSLLLGLGTGWSTIALIAVCPAICIALLLYRHHRVHKNPAGLLPARWAMALAPATSTPSARGPIVPREELLRAPFSGRTCIAWEIGVRRDDNAEGDLGSWELLEQRIAPATVGDEPIDPATTHLSVARTRLGSMQTYELDEAAQTFLKQRGLGDIGFDAELFETIIEAGDAVTLAFDRARTRSVVGVDHDNPRKAIV